MILTSIMGRGRSLRAQVRTACGPADQFATLGYRFGDWVELGPSAPPATVTEVEQHVAGYLDLARRTGRRWGIRVGIGAGIAGGTAIGALAWLWTVLS